MALVGTTVDVPFKPVNQQKPGTSALVGSLRSVKNGIVTKYTRPSAQGESTQLRVSKRNGFRQQPVLNYSPVSGIPVSTNLSGFAGDPTLYSSLNAQQVVVSTSLPYVLAENSPKWSKFTYVTPVQSLSKRVVYTGTTQYGAFDSANIGNVFLYVWHDLFQGNNYFYVVDKDGTPIRSPVVSDGTLVTIPNGASAKCVSDGVNFWVVYHTTGVLRAMLVSPHGVVLDNDQVGTFVEDESNPWKGHFDVTYQQGQVLVAKTSSVPLYETVQIVQLSGTTSITQTTTNLFDELANVGLNWMENASSPNDGFVYLLTAHFDPDATSVEYAQKISFVATVPTHVQTWQLFTQDGNGAFVGHLVGMSGAMCTDGQLRGNLSFRFANVQQCVTQTFQADPGGAVLRLGQHRQTIVGGRTFTLDGRQHALLFYPSAAAVSFTDPTTGKLTQGFSQPTYFLVDLMTRQITGRWEYANAGGAWLFSGDDFNAGVTNQGQFYFHNPSPFIDTDNIIHVGLGYLATTVEASTLARITAINANLTQDIVNAVTVPAAFTALTSFQQTATVGLADYRFGITGQAFEFGGELFIPGPIGKTFGGSVFSENGLNLAPEQPLSITGGTGGQLRLLGRYSYVLVWEWTDPTGKRHRSSPCAAFSANLTGSNNRLTLQGLPLSMTSHPDATLGVYRTYYQGTPATISTQFRKVSNDLSPTLNHPGDQTWTFVDDASDVAASVGELLYSGAGGQGMLARDPCPAFSEGCVFQDRVFVIGWDGRIWYSAEFDDSGEATWFSQDTMVISLPGDDYAVKLTPVDGRIIITGNSGFWELDGRGFSNNTGSDVSVIAPQRLPINMGGTKYSCMGEKGVIFQSTINGVAGGLYMMNRGLTTDQYSNDVQDELDGRTVIGLTVDETNRVYCAVSATESAPASMFVYDQNSETWSTYTLTSDALLIHRKSGKISYVDSFQVMAQDSDNLFADAYDETGAEQIPYITAIQTEFYALGGIKNFKRCWQYIINGEYKGEHNLLVTAVSDTNGDLVETNWTLEPEPDETYQFWLQPVVEEASRVSFLFQDNYYLHPDPGDTFTLELVSFYVATEKGLTRLDSSTSPEVSRPLTIQSATQRAKLLARINTVTSSFSDDFTVLPGAMGSNWTVAAMAGTGSAISRAANGYVQIKAVGTPGTGSVVIQATTGSALTIPTPASTKFYLAFAVQFLSAFDALESFGEGFKEVALSGQVVFGGYGAAFSSTSFSIGKTGPLTSRVYPGRRLDNDRYVIEFWSKGDGILGSAFDNSIPVSLSMAGRTTSYITIRCDALTGGTSIHTIQNCILLLGT